MVQDFFFFLYFDMSANSRLKKARKNFIFVFETNVFNKLDELCLFWLCGPDRNNLTTVDFHETVYRHVWSPEEDDLG